MLDGRRRRRTSRRPADHVEIIENSNRQATADLLHGGVVQPFDQIVAGDVNAHDEVPTDGS